MITTSAVRAVVIERDRSEPDIATQVGRRRGLGPGYNAV